MYKEFTGAYSFTIHFPLQWEEDQNGLRTREENQRAKEKGRESLIFEAKNVLNQKTPGIV